MSGATNTEGYVVRTDSSGNIYEGGHAADSTGINYWFVREYNASTSTWSLIDQYAGESGLGARADDITFDSNGDLIVGGYYIKDSSNDIGWAVRKGTFSF
jgi:hypothetical protein